MPFEVRQAMDVAFEDHRAPDLPEFMLLHFSRLKKVFKTETGHVFVFPGLETALGVRNKQHTAVKDKVLTASGQFHHCG